MIIRLKQGWFGILLASTFVVLLTFGVYGYWYHSLALEGWKLFNSRCREVNPYLVQVRKQHLELGDAINGDSVKLSADQVVPKIRELVFKTREYLSKEAKWNSDYSDFLNRLDVKLIEPEYIKVAGKYQLGMYQAYYDYYSALNDFFSYSMGIGVSTDSAKSHDAYAIFMNKGEELAKNKTLYFEAVDKGLNVVDWRKALGRVPDSECKEEDLRIP